MEVSAVTARKALPPPSWHQVRPLYKKLSDEFHLLTDAFGLQISPQTKTYLDHLIIVIDEVDHCIDSIPDRAARDSVMQSLIEFLENDASAWSHPSATPSLSRKMEHIKLIVHRVDIVEEFVDAARIIFHNTEIKRHTTDIGQLLAFITDEGRATARLPLSILRVDPAEPFGTFFTRLCTLMGMADLIFDAREDYQNGILAMKPSIGLYVKLHGIMIKEGLRLLRSFPDKLKFLVYCFKFTVALIKA